MVGTICLGRKNFLTRLEEQIVGAFANSLAVEKVSERLRLLVVASKKTAAAGTIEKDCFQYKIYYFATVTFVAIAVANLQW